MNNISNSHQLFIGGTFPGSMRLCWVWAAQSSSASLHLVALQPLSCGSPCSQAGPPHPAEHPLHASPDRLRHPDLDHDPTQCTHGAAL